MIVWLNGEFRDGGAAIDVADRGFLLGDGAFETLYVENGRPAFLGEHLARLHRGFAALKITPPEALSEMRAIIARLAHENRFSEGRAAARITVTRGPGGRGLVFPPTEETTPTMLVTLGPAPAPAEAPLRLFLSGRRRYSGAAAAGFKSVGGYVDNILAFNEARQAGADDALLLNEKGRLASTARANLFLIDEAGAVITPPEGEGALPGVVRALLIAGAGEHGVSIAQTPIAPGDLARTQLFVTNSLLGLAPAELVSGAGSSAPTARDVFTRLQTWYWERLQVASCGLQSDAATRNLPPAT